MESSLRDVMKQWQLKADHDLILVEKNIKDKDAPADILCFHCQQVVEKYLKSFLIFHGIHPPKTHDIKTILNLCEKIAPDFIGLRDKVYLTDFAVEIRYPDDMFMPDPDILQKAFEDALDVKSFVLKKIE